MKKVITYMLAILALIMGSLTCVFKTMYRSECGAVVTSDFLAGLMTNFRVIFREAIGEAGKMLDLVKEIATEFPSTTDQESYGWMGANPSMREWTDTRVYKALKAYSYSLVNKHYEGTIEVDRNTYEDDKYGMIAPRIKGLANRAMRHINQLVIECLDNGEVGLAFDGTAMFDGSRTIGDSGAIDNLLDGAYSGSSAEIQAAIKAAYVAMGNFKDDKGVKMGLVPDLIVCSTTMLIPMQTALLPSIAGTELPEARLIPPSRVKASPWIDADVLDWYLLCTQAEVKPIVLQMRKQPEFVSLDDPKSEHVFKNKTFLYGVDDRFVVGYGDPRTAIKITDNS